MLLKQEKAEAESAVEGRLEFIGNEMKRVEKVISEMQEQSEGKKMEVSLFSCWGRGFGMERMGGEELEGRGSVVDGVSDADVLVGLSVANEDAGREMRSCCGLRGFCIATIGR